MLPPPLNVVAVADIVSAPLATAATSPTPPANTVAFWARSSWENRVILPVPPTALMPLLMVSLSPAEPLSIASRPMSPPAVEVTVPFTVIVVEKNLTSPAAATGPVTVSVSLFVPVSTTRLVLLWALLALAIVTVSAPSAAVVVISTVPLFHSATDSMPTPPEVPLTTRAGIVPVAKSKPLATVSTSSALGGLTMATSMPLISTGSRSVKLIGTPSILTVPSPVVVADGV
ncbi:MAG: hypothetical protein U0797_21460 [Gemmataceae bacterium]